MAPLAMAPGFAAGSGAAVFGAGVYGLFHPPPVALASLHVGVWWGALLVVIGLGYVRAFRPRR